MHSAIERLLGDVGRKIHAGRSRNDQVAAAFRLYVSHAAAEAEEALRDLARAILSRAADEAETPMPGYTHLQRAIPVTLGHHLLAWTEMLERDRARLRFAGAQAILSPLGSGALAGSTLEIPPPPDPMRNSMDAVADRDFALDYLYAVSAALRPPLADRRGDRALDDLRVRLRPAAGGGGDRFVDDAAEAERRRRRAGARQGGDGDRAAHRAARDGQRAPAGLQPRPAGGQASGVRGPRDAKSALDALTVLVRGLDFDRERMALACADPLLRATDAAEALVREGVPFRDAHEQVAASVREGTFAAPADTPPRLGDVGAAVDAAKERWL